MVVCQVTTAADTIQGMAADTIQGMAADTINTLDITEGTVVTDITEGTVVTDMIQGTVEADTTIHTVVADTIHTQWVISKKIKKETSLKLNMKIKKEKIR